MNRHLKEEEIVLHLDARTSPVEQGRVGRHLAECAACRKRVQALRAVHRVMEEWPAVEPSAGFDAGVRQRIRLEREETSFFRLLHLRPAYGLALVGIILVGVVLWQADISKHFPAVTGEGGQVRQGDFKPSGEGVFVDLVSGESDDAVILDDASLTQDYDLLEQFDILFDPLPQGEREKREM